MNEAVNITFNVILKVFGLLLILLALLICLLFFIWVIKLEFEWFFETDMFKWLNDLSNKLKIKFKKKEGDVHKTVKFLNNKKKIKKNIRLNEDMTLKNIADDEFSDSAGETFFR